MYVYTIGLPLTPATRFFGAETMTYLIHLAGMSRPISADSAAEALRKARALMATGRKVTVHNVNGEPVSLNMLELVADPLREGDNL